MISGHRTALRRDAICSNRYVPTYMALKTKIYSLGNVK